MNHPANKGAVSLLAGALLLGEPISARLGIALLALAAGIVLVNKR